MLKQLLAILILVSLAYRPVFQMGEISYYQFNLDYIIENYCVNQDQPALNCNGKCYLMQQLNQSNKTEKANTSARIANSFLPLYLEIPRHIDFSQLELFKVNKKIVFYKHFISNPYYRRIEHPPSCS
ncbi:hypothetical protein [Zunongwangia sp. HRR-M8]|uniref:hypothetical protein n=1 Tax=Zunongwangia sp. HRR-M8 TaxID=3015170 RepID=UPI0022DD3408|nr:hypothetical protein [Zunongwangia sp. HRR-M8]WBL23897.1 hypothetical protein PBT89_08020 [Zunongwangia sp. HRR-M8]